ncbi:ribonuclease HI family protein [Candidatus Daviesbacteria bacterium]|nr:ribonuclease HI family protein [Candidatus Daviesbacteria bacterium]
MKLIIYTDGASRGNPGKASYGFTISEKSGKLIHQEGKYIGVTTNNVAEYTAVLKALQYVKDNLSEEIETTELFADSKLVAEQLSGNFKIKAKHLKPIFQQIKILSLELCGVTFSHVPRSENFRADQLANEALDRIY